MNRLKIGRMFILFSALLTFGLCGCTSKAVKYLERRTDKIVITMYARDGGDIDEEYTDITLTEQEEITKVIGFISSQSAPFYKCGYHGAIQFFEDDKPLLEDKAEFNIDPDCNHIVFLYNDTLYSKKLTEDAVDYLKRLRSIKNNRVR